MGDLSKESAAMMQQLAKIQEELNRSVLDESAAKTLGMSAVSGACVLAFPLFYINTQL